MLTVCATATGDLLADLADVRDALGIDDYQYDQTLTRMIRRASSRVESFVGYPLLVQVYQAILPGYGRRALLLPRHPVRHVFRVFDGSDTGVDAEISATGYHLNAEAGMLERDEGWVWTYKAIADISIFPEPDQEYPQYLVDFSAGYIQPTGKDSTVDGTTATGQTLDQTIQDAVISLVRTMWHDRMRPSNVRSRSVGEISISYGETRGELPDDVLAMLAPFKSNF